MNNTGSEIKIVICGTRKSMFLDPNEKQVMKFAPGEPFRDGINTLDDLIDNTIEVASMYGDTIEHFFVGTTDFISAMIKEAITSNKSNIEEAIDYLSNHPIFINYDPSDLRERVMEEASFLV